MTNRSVFLVDDDNEFRESAGWWLESLDYDVTAFGDPSAFLAHITTVTDGPEKAILLDVRMPQMSGLQVLEQLKSAGIALPVVFVTGHGDVPLAVEAMRQGAVTFLEKPLDSDALMQALDLAFERATSPATDSTEISPELQARVDSLTEREAEIYRLIVEGKMNKTVAFELDISIKTVELHRKRVMDKMQARSLPHLLRMAMMGQVLEADE